MAQLMEYIKMAFKNIAANKGRTFLTMLGIIIGISSVILILSIGDGASNMISSELNTLTNNKFTIQLRQYEEKYYITKEDIEGVREIEGVKAVGFEDYQRGAIKTKRDEFDALCYMINGEGFEFLEAEFVKGGPYTESQANEGKALCVMEESHAIKLFGSTNVIGMELNVNISDYGIEIPLTVCGIIKSEDSSEMIESMIGAKRVFIYFPQEAFTKSSGYDISKYIDSFQVLTEDDADKEKIRDEIVHYLEVQHHCIGKDVYDNDSMEGEIDVINKTIKLITIFVAFVASVSLLVGGIGVMNIMLVSVTERTREIGIRKALGAKTGSITVQFLAESAFITLIGGIIGIIVGILGAKLITSVIGMLLQEMSFSPVLSLKTILLATTFSSGVGLLFGVYPARKAAKLSPIEALRHN